MSENLISYHKTVVSTEQVGANARFQQAIALSKLNEMNNWKKALSEEELTQVQTWTQYHLKYTPSLAASSVSEAMHVARWLTPEIIAGRQDELAAVGITKLYKAKKMMDNKTFATTEEAIQAAKTMSLSELRQNRQGQEELSFSQLWEDRVPSQIASMLSQNVSRFRNAIRATEGTEGSNLQALELMLNTVGFLPDEFILEQAGGQGGAVPDVIAGYDLTVTPPAQLLEVISKKYVELGYSPDEVLENMKSIFQKEVAVRAEIEAEHKRIKAETAKAERDAERAKRAEIAGQNKEINSQKRAIAKLEGVRDGAIVVFNDPNYHGTVLVNNKDSQVFGIRWGSVEAKTLGEDLPNVKSGDDQSILSYAVIIDILGGIKSVKNAALAKPKPTKPAKAAPPALSKAAQTAKSKTKGKK